MPCPLHRQKDATSGSTKRPLRVTPPCDPALSAHRAASVTPAPPSRHAEGLESPIPPGLSITRADRPGGGAGRDVTVSSTSRSCQTPVRGDDAVKEARLPVGGRPSQTVVPSYGNVADRSASARRSVSVPDGLAGRVRAFRIRDTGPGHGRHIPSISARDGGSRAAPERAVKQRGETARFGPSNRGHTRSMHPAGGVGARILRH